MKLAGIVLIVLGIIALVYQGFSFTSKNRTPNWVRWSSATMKPITSGFRRSSGGR